MNVERTFILRGGRAWAVPGADAVAHRGGEILATDRLDALVDRFPHAEVHDWGSEALLVPGFNDAHMHLAIMAERTCYVDLTEATSVAEVRAALADRASNVAADEWVRGFGYDPFRFADGELDRVCLDHVGNPVLVTHVAGHWGVINSAAMARAGMDETTPPPDGGKFGRDSDGGFNGCVYEQALFDLCQPGASEGGPVVPPPTDAERLDGLREVVRRLHSVGITSVTDALVNHDHITALESLHSDGDLGVRVSYLAGWSVSHDLRARGVVSGVGDRWLRMDGVKFILDGAIGGKTCLLTEPFTGSTDTGIQSMPTDQFESVVDEAISLGQRVAVHANGDKAIAIALDALTSSVSRHGTHARHRIEHGTVVDRELIHRLRDADVAVTPFGSYVAVHGPKVLEWFGAERVERMFAHRDLLDAGIVVGGSSDHPCAPVDPLLGVQSCVTRRSLDGVSVGASQRITVDEAIALYTSGSAAVEGTAAWKGTLQPGSVADLAVLERNPSSVDPMGIHEIATLATYVAGRVVYDATASTTSTKPRS